MSSYNKVILIGNITRDPALSYLPSQTPVVDFGLATNKKWTNKSGESKEEICFIDCRSFGKSAETINKYVFKGDLFMCDGRLTFEQWTTQDGIKRSRHRVVVEGFQFLPNKQREQSPQTDEQPTAQADSNDIPF